MTALTTPRSRLLAIGCCLLILGGLFVWMGMAEPNPDRHNYPDDTHLTEDYDAYVGQQATVHGIVVETDPLVIETGESIRLTIVDSEAEPTEGEHLTAFGTVEPDQTIDAESSFTREPWEMAYMYGVSLLAGLWVLVRFVRRWRFSTTEWAFVPRNTPLSITRTVGTAEPDRSEGD